MSAPHRQESPAYVESEVAVDRNNQPVAVTLRTNQSGQWISADYAVVQEDPDARPLYEPAP